ncbi:MAG TPA: hypothetical protein VKQ36_06995 [Ktedonobacterales bacterium]|nr:hypothetical protein [Ktedonobacterales bacterium]
MPDMMQKLGSQPLTPAHQFAIQRGANMLNELTGTPHAAIYNELRQAFKVGKYNQIPDARWSDVVAWFKPRIRAAEQRAGARQHSNPFDEDTPEQGSLF